MSEEQLATFDELAKKVDTYAERTNTNSPRRAQ